MTVIKRDGTREEFNPDKIRDAILRAYKACDVECTDLESISVFCTAVQDMENDNIELHVEEIQDLVETFLMDEGPYVVARAYMLYRERHKNTRQFVDKKKAFINRYKGASNTANATVDDNSNVNGKNIGILNAEIHKEDNIQINRGMIVGKLRELYPDFDAKQYIRDLENHIIYKHDESSFAGAISPYCCSISMYPFITSGIKDIGGLSAAPKNLDSYCGMYINLIFAVAAQFAGACMYKDQLLKVRTSKGAKQITAKELVEDNLIHPNSFTNYQGQWEYANCSDLQILEDGKLVNVQKVYRRKYHDKIYKITTKDGYSARVSKDHVFKQLLQGRQLDIKASQLQVGDTVFMNKDFSSIIDFNSVNFKKGWVVGIICGDGCLTQENAVKLSVNYDQEYLGDIYNQYSEELYGVKLHKNSGHKCWNFTKTNKDYYAQIHADIIGNTTYDKHIDTENKSLDYLAGFLDGLFCADGSCTETKGISICLTNRDLAENISQIASIFGILNKICTVAARGNRKEAYSQYVSSRILKYLKHVHRKIRNKRKDINIDITRENYAYGYNAFQGRHKASKRMLWHNSNHCKENFFTDVIDSIEVFDNDDDYVYEIETSTHWYNCGGFITHNCATSEFLVYFDWFARKEWGDNYYLKPDAIITSDYCKRKMTIQGQIHQYFQQVIYSINQPAAARGMQSAFVNFSLFDKDFFNGMFDNFYFPDGEQAKWESVCWLQKDFLHWFNQERLKCILTFPVVSCTLLYKDGKFQDEDFFNFICEEYAQGNSFFLYISDSVDSLSSCCRLKNKIQTKEFNFTNGNMGVETGSKSVISLNLNRIVQDYCCAARYAKGCFTDGKHDVSIFEVGLKEYLEEILERVYKYQTAYNELLWDMYNANLLPVYKAGFIDLNRQYLTIGLIGTSAAAEYLGIKISDNEDYKVFCQTLFGFIKEQNTLHKTKKTTWNTEQVPSESAAIKLYDADKKDGYWVPEDINLYTSYIFKPYDKNLPFMQRIVLHGKNYIGDYLDGGSAAHLNLEEHLSKEQYMKVLAFAAENGCQYLTFNVPNSECEDCGFITKVPISECPKCGSKKIALYDRIIGYLTKIKNWSKGRQIEQKKRVYSKNIC